MSGSDGPAREAALARRLAGGGAAAVIRALAAGADVRFVGGCVRDGLAGGAIGDIDLATAAPPQRAMALLAAAGIRTRATGLEHGTVTALAGGEAFEITTLRLDARTDGRHAQVVFTDDWRRDAARRDFTFNAMNLTPDGRLYDYFGGRGDLARGRVRFVGAPARRIGEDRLRALRFFRFLARFGRGAPDALALAACRAAAPHLGALSAERVRGELLKMLAAPGAALASEEMRRAGVLAAVLPEAAPGGALAALMRIDDGDPLLRLAALTGASAGRAAVRLKLSRTERRRLEALATPAGRPTPALEARARRRLLYELGRERFRDLALLAWAGEGDGRDGAWRAMLEEAAGWQRPSLPIAGDDALAAGARPGPALGRALAAVEAWWRDEDFRPGREACLARLRQELAAGTEPPYVNDG